MNNMTLTGDEVLPSMDWSIYLILEKDHRGKYFYCGKSSRPFQRELEHDKKRYDVKCTQCHGKGGYDTWLNGGSGPRIWVACKSCKGTKKVQGERFKLGRMHVIESGLTASGAFDREQYWKKQSFNKKMDIYLQSSLPEVNKV